VVRKTGLLLPSINPVESPLATAFLTVFVIGTAVST
jgi:hypothetical protein